MSVDGAPGLDAWEPWSPAEVAERFRSCQVPWGMAGGWALDLWLNRQTRPHADIEIAAPATALEALAGCLPGYCFYRAQDGELTRLDPAQPGAARQVWVFDPVACRWRVDMMFDPGDARTWVYRRDPRIHAPRDEMIAATREGIPFLRPEGVLLFKGKNPRPKDELDFDRCLPELSNSQCQWLRQALITAHPESRWIELLHSN